MDWRNGLGTRLAKLRNEKGFTQKMIAEALFTTRQAVSSWEHVGIEGSNNAQPPSIDNMVRLAELYGVTCDELILGIKPDNVHTARETGLSDAAIEQLKWYKDKSPVALKLVDWFLTDAATSTLYYDAENAINFAIYKQDGSFVRYFDDSVGIVIANEKAVDKSFLLDFYYKYAEYVTRDAAEAFKRMFESFIDSEVKRHAEKDNT